MVIGVFRPGRDGGWEGHIHTLTIDTKARFVPNDDRENDRAPMFHIIAGQAELGAAWRRLSNAKNRAYLSVELDDPSLPEPILAAMFEAQDGQSAHLVWTRKRSE